MMFFNFVLTKAAPFPGFYMLEFQNLINISINLYGNAVLKISCCDHLSSSFNRASEQTLYL